MPIHITGLQCPICHDVIFSCSRHDYRKCRCGEIAVDGGRDYLRKLYKSTPPNNIKIKLCKGLSEYTISNNEDYFGRVKRSRPCLTSKTYTLRHDGTLR